jgi:hypothetical protein
LTGSPGFPLGVGPLLVRRRASVGSRRVSGPGWRWSVHRNRDQLLWSSCGDDAVPLAVPLAVPPTRAERSSSGYGNDGSSITFHPHFYTQKLIIWGCRRSRRPRSPSGWRLARHHDPGKSPPTRTRCPLGQAGTRVSRRSLSCRVGNEGRRRNARLAGWNEPAFVSYVPRNLGGGRRGRG